MAVGRQMAYHNLAVMLGAGLPVTRAVAVITQGCRGRLARDFRALGAAIAGGATVTEAMAARPRSFPAFDVLIVQAGETSGTLDEAFRRLADAYAFRRRLKRIIAAGLAYPLFILHAAALVVPLPGMFMSGFKLEAYVLAVIRFLLVFYIPAAVILLIAWLGRTFRILRRGLDSVALHVPLLGKGLLRMALSKFCVSFQALLRAGVPITRSIPDAAGTCGNMAAAVMLAGAAQSVRQGNPAWQGFSHGLPREFTAAWQAGEESGSLDDVVGRLAQSQGELAQSRLTELAKWLPRVIYFIIMLYLAAIALTLAMGVMGRVG